MKKLALLLSGTIGEHLVKSYANRACAGDPIIWKIAVIAKKKGFKHNTIGSFIKV